MSGSARHKTVAFILSGIFPGLGQLYNRQPLKAVAFIAAGGVLTWLTGRSVSVDRLLQAALSGQDALLQQDLLGVSVILPLCLLLLIWGWSLVDAWRLAGR